MPQRYGRSGELSLPDLSNASFSFQIPNSLTNTDLLTEDNDADFFKDASLLATPGPSRVRNSPAMTLADVTPRPKTHDSHPEPEPSPLTLSVNFPSIPEDAKRTPQAHGREAHSRQPTSKPNSPTKPKLKLVTSPVKFPMALGTGGASPVAERFESLRAEVEKLEDDDGDLHPHNSATNGESSSTNVTVTQGSRKIKVPRERERAIPKPTKRTVVFGGVSKTRSKTTLPASTTLSREPASAPQAYLPSQQPFSYSSSQPSSGNDGISNQNPDASICSTVEGGVAERLVMYSQRLMESYGSLLPAQSTPQSQTKPDATPQPPPPAPSQSVLPPNPNEHPESISPSHNQSQSLASNDRQEPFTLSQLSPRKHTTAEQIHVSHLPSPSSSAHMDSNTSPTSPGGRSALVLSPMRPAKKRPSSAAANMNADGDTDTAAGGTESSQPLHVQKKKKKGKGKAKAKVNPASAAAAAAVTSGQKTSDANGGKANPNTGMNREGGGGGGGGGDDAMLQGEEVPLGSNASLGPLTRTGLRAKNGSTRPRTTRMITRGALKAQKAGGSGGAASAMRRPEHRTGSRSGLGLSSSCAVVVRQAPGVVGKEQDGASGAIGKLGMERGALTTVRDPRSDDVGVVGLGRDDDGCMDKDVDVDTAEPGGNHSENVPNTEEGDSKPVAAPPPPPPLTKTQPAGFKFQVDARLAARKAEYERMAKGSTAERACMQTSKTSSTSSGPDVMDAKYFSGSSSSSLSSLRAVGQQHGSKEGVGVTVPVPFDFQTAARAQSRAQFDERAREREREREREEEGRRREREEEEEREVREMRRRAVPKANEVPGWYRDAPRRRT